MGAGLRAGSLFLWRRARPAAAALQTPCSAPGAFDIAAANYAFGYAF